MYADNNKINKELFDVNKQISSGQKIQYAYDDTTTFIDALRLDNEITTLNQVKDSATSAYKFSTQSDSTLSEITKTLDAFKTKLINATSGVHSDNSLNAIAGELSSLKDHLISLSNTSIGGKYLFSGTSTLTKPIADDGEYRGNDGELKAFLGSNVQQNYNVSGEDLFLGEESKTNRKISLNLPLYNQKDLHPEVMIDKSFANDRAVKTFIKSTDTIRDLMGDNDDKTDILNAKHGFYVRGVQSDGTPFKDLISLRDDETVDDLLGKIGKLFGNTVNNEVVNIEINSQGQIEIEDKKRGSSKLDFTMIGTTALSFDSKITTDTAPAVLPAPVAPLTDNSRLTVPVNSVANATLNAGDTLSINGNIYTVATPLAAIAHPTDPTLEVISLTEDVKNGPISNVEVLKSTGYNIDNDPANAYEFNKHGVPVKEFMKSDFTEHSYSITQERSIFDNNSFTLAGDFITKGSEKAKSSTLLTDIFRSDVKSIELAGIAAAVQTNIAPASIAAPPIAANSFFDITSSSTVKDLMEGIKVAYDPGDEGLISVDLIDGKIAFGRATDFEFASTQSTIKGSMTLSIGSNSSSYQPSVGDILTLDGHESNYTVQSIAAGIITLDRPLEKDVAFNEEMNLSTTRFDKIEVKLESYSQTGGAAAAVPPGTSVRVEGLPSSTAVTYDEAAFTLDGNKLLSNVPQIVVSDNSYAEAKTKLIDVAGTSTFGTGTTAEVISFKGIDIAGASFDAKIHLNNDLQTIPLQPSQIAPAGPYPAGTTFEAKSYFSVTDAAGVTTEYPIFSPNFIDSNDDGLFTLDNTVPNALPTDTSHPIDNEVLTAGDDLSYQQFNDIVNMIITDRLPQDNVIPTAFPPVSPNPVTLSGNGYIHFGEYNQAIADSKILAETGLDTEGKMVFEEHSITSTKASITLSDNSASNFADTNATVNGIQADAALFNFQSNNALTVRDAKTDFFARIDDMIKSVEEGRYRADGNDDDPRNVGMQNSIQMLDDLIDHVGSQQSKAGVQSQTLQTARDRTSLLVVTSSILRSETLDTDIAEASLKLQQLQINLQALYSTVGKVQQLSLINYL
jgi:flagellin-like hook-associated protein FlgL